VEAKRKTVRKLVVGTGDLHAKSKPYAQPSLEALKLVLIPDLAPSWHVASIRSGVSTWDEDLPMRRPRF
jgi:hypothetical protein